LKVENEDIVNKVIKNNPNLKIETIKISSNIPLLPSKIDGTICVKPTKYFEGFFMAKIAKIK
jgi:16S rRNA C967 or C1407 C5-methylase (RsmB/RsmF family)